MPINATYPRYKGAAVAPNTQLAEALLAGNHERAAAIFKQCEDDAAKLLTRYKSEGPKQ